MTLEQYMEKNHLKQSWLMDLLDVDKSTASLMVRRKVKHWSFERVELLRQAMGNDFIYVDLLPE